MRPSRYFIITAVLLVGIIVLLPIGYMLTAPFWTAQEPGSDRFISLFESRQLPLVKNSLVLAVGTALLCLAIGVPFAFFTGRTDLRGKGLFGILYIIPVLIPPYIHAIVWKHLNPFLNYFIRIDIHSLWGSIWVLTLAYFPYVTLTTLTGLNSIDRNQEEAAVQCRGQATTLRRISLPLSLPHIASGALIVFIFALIDVGVPDILRLKVYPLEIFIQFSAFYDPRAAMLLSLPLIMTTLLLLVLLRAYMQDRSYVQTFGGIQKPMQISLGGGNIIALLFCSLIMVFSVGLPVVVLLNIAGPPQTYYNALNASIEQIGYSLLLAVGGSFFTVIFGFFLAYLIERTQRFSASLLSWSAFLPLAIPATTLGIGMIMIWNRPPADFIYDSSIIIILGYVARFIPHAVIVLNAGMKQIHPHMEEAAMLSGAHGAKILRKIVWPLSRPSLIAGFFIVFILSFGELGTTLLIIPPGRETIPIKIYNLMHYGAEQTVAALCLILIVLMLAIAGGVLISYKKLLMAPVEHDRS